MQKKFSWNKDGAIPADAWYNFEMTLNPAADEMFEPVKAVFEIEILKGERKVLRNGQIRYRMFLPPEKEQLIKDAMFHAVSDASGN